MSTSDVPFCQRQIDTTNAATLTCTIHIFNAGLLPHIHLHCTANDAATDRLCQFRIWQQTVTTSKIIAGDRFVLPGTHRLHCV